MDKVSKEILMNIVSFAAFDFNSKPDYFSRS